ncbi:MAG: GNAT family N-acetyltransferase, partial [Acidobacteria bacterium]|nr:GNAT family N-acetyltransferase [Acidobacteriota bacterium]
DEYGLKPDREGIDQDLDDIEANYISRGGLFEVMEDVHGNLLGTAGLYPFDENRIELRKMYIRPEARGKGLGKTTLKRMIDSARRLGYEQMILETADVLIEAIGLYEKFGFRQMSETHADRCDRAYYLDLD